MRKSKYLGLKSGNWICTHVGIDRVQPVYRKTRDRYGNRVKNKYPGHRSYYYTFERPTSDQKAIKVVRLNARQAYQVFTGEYTVEDFAIQKKAQKSQAFKNKVSYCFYD